MLKSTVKITHESGLSARPAALLVQVANRFNSRIWVNTGSKKVNAKSIMGIMSLGISLDEKVIIIVQGEDEKEAMNALLELVEGNFADLPEL